MPFQVTVRNLHILSTVIFVNLLIIRPYVVKAFVFERQSSHTHTTSFHRQGSSAFKSAALPSPPASSLWTPTSSLASKIIFQSPAMENIYREILVSSKPLNIHKQDYIGGNIKKPKKDSKIYYIPIPAMPYRFIPGFGYDYQPMRINTLPQKSSLLPVNDYIQGPKKSQKLQTHTGPLHHHNSVNHIKSHGTTINKKQTADVIKVAASNSSLKTGESQIIRLNRGDYFFNGRPFRLQAANAQPKNHLTSQNLKTKLYFNKKIIH